MGIKEKDLATIESLSDGDKLRVVTGGGGSRNIDANAIIPTLQAIFEAMPEQEVRIELGEEAGALPSFTMSDPTFGSIGINFAEGFSVRKGNNGFCVKTDGTPEFRGNALSAWQSALGIGGWKDNLKADTYISMNSQADKADATAMGSGTYYPCFFIYDDIDFENNIVTADRVALGGGGSLQRSVSTKLAETNVMWMSTQKCLGFFKPSSSSTSYDFYIIDVSDFKAADQTPYNVPNNVKAILVLLSSPSSINSTVNVISFSNYVAHRIVSIE